MKMDARYLRNLMLVLLAIAVVLVVLSPILQPSMLTASSNGWLSVEGALLALAIYAVLAVFALPATERRNSVVVPLAALFGLLIGAVFAVEIVSEYIILPADNTTMGLVEYGLVFVLLFIAGLRGAVVTGKMRWGMVTALWSSVLGTLIFLIAALAVSHLFHGSPQQTQAAAAEGDFEDFARSGMTDFWAFYMQDMLGAAFYHLLLLAPVSALVFGTFGSVVGKLVHSLRRKTA